MIKRSPEKYLFVILLFTVASFFTDKPAGAEEKYLFKGPVMSSIRPKIEYISRDSKEPFQDYFSKKKPVVEEPVEEMPESEIAVIPEEPKPKPPLPSLTVQGIIWGGSTPCAIINNKVLKQGDSMQGIKIIKIEKENIEVLYQDWNYNLSSPVDSSPDKKSEGGENE